MTPRIAVLFLAATLSVPAFAASKESVVYAFGALGGDGNNPFDSVVADSAGNLYGTTENGGIYDKGTVFKITPRGVETVLYSFKGAPSDGEEPDPALTFGADGDLHGVTIIGGTTDHGTVFKLNPLNGAEYVLYSFCPSPPACTDGYGPGAPLIFDLNGSLYGTTGGGGSGTVEANSGVVFRLDPLDNGGLRWRETPIHSFCNQTSCADGKNPSVGRLLLTGTATTGTLYGTTTYGQQGGTVYSVSTTGTNFQTLHVFTTTGTQDGVTPYAGVVASRNGTLYGVTTAGGTHNNCGMAYSLVPSSLAYQPIYEFCSQANDPASPWGGLTVVENKRRIMLYGASAGGGRKNAGTFYRLTSPATPSGSWTARTLHSFCSRAGCRDGHYAYSTPLRLNGAFYATTYGGGAHQEGTVYRFGPSTP